MPPIPAAYGLRYRDSHARLAVHRGVPGRDEAQISNACKEAEAIRGNGEILIPIINPLTDPAFATDAVEDDRRPLKSPMVFACVIEGVFFYAGFTSIPALGRHNKTMGAAQRYRSILRDESMHCNFAPDAIVTITMENPLPWRAAVGEEIRRCICNRPTSNMRAPATPSCALCRPRRGHVQRLPALHRAPPRAAVRTRRAVCTGRKSAPVDERDDRPEKGAPLCRDARDEVPKRRRIELRINDFQNARRAWRARRRKKK
ncbi:ribonucleotide-diphosphate reductase subunit beta [Massilia sp. CCM 9210]|uniref:ribonucleotide-diphosphate reductase subunit beta n=1 Tax=Massilia scottii TaxID=3057166 RepID=UPI0027967734|nr:ribonucleotide-diphosphate reductase subunit beta [Massilia sp. CCM 9210]MDQ1812587.1 ribonucleotide-diphosphate reductase subunit beta [Massilia sp. CCM 9210]